MRKIEKAMLAAIKGQKNFMQGNTCVIFSDHIGNPYLAATVYLYDNQIAEILPDGMVAPDTDTFKAWPTATTASRLCALGIDATIKKFKPCIDGKPL